MPIACLGLSHHTASVSGREQLAFSRDGVRRFLTDLDRQQAWAAGIGEAVLISTCSRTELYVASRTPAERFSSVPSFATDLLLGSHDLTHESVRRYLYTRTGVEAVSHLCRVASGIESMVVGEYEVLGQVVVAHGLAADAGTTGLILDAVFRAAIRAGRRARAETGIARAATSVASEAVRLAETLVEAGSGPSVVVLGAGQMARLLVEILARRGFRNLRIVGRTVSRAQTIARGVGGASVSWADLPRALREADLLFSSTSAPQAVVTAGLLSDALNGRQDRPITCLDLAVPRDIEPVVRTLGNVTLYDLDDLQDRVELNRRSRELERPRVEEIVQQEVAQFLAWLHGAELRPVLAAMHARGEEIARREVERTLRRHPEVDPALREEMERLSLSIVAKLLHGPSARLRTETDPLRSQQYVGALQQLFGLPDGGERRFAGPP